jgi:hypothetical protein
MTSYAAVADLRAYLPQVSAYGMQLITVSGTPFTLVYEGVSTGNLASTATATAVQTALRAITAIGSSGVNVRGKPGGPFTASFQGSLATDAALMTANNATVTPATDDLLQDCLDRATDIVRGALRSLLADPLFDYAAYSAASTAIVLGYDGQYLRLPRYQAGSVTLVEWQIGANPAAYQAIPDQWIEESGRLYRAIGWGASSTYGGRPRYRITAVWGYGPTVPDAVAEVTLEQAVNVWRSKDKGGFSEVIGADGSGAVKQVAGLNKLQMQVLTSLRDELIALGV